MPRAFLVKKKEKLVVQRNANNNNNNNNNNDKNDNTCKTTNNNDSKTFKRAADSQSDALEFAIDNGCRVDICRSSQQRPKAHLHQQLQPPQPDAEADIRSASSVLNSSERRLDGGSDGIGQGEYLYNVPHN